MAAVVNCPRCSREVQVPDHLHDSAVICPWCNQRFAAPPFMPPPMPTVRRSPPPPSPAEMKKCATCDADIRKAAVVCPSCGVPQPAMTTAAAATSRPDVPRGTSRVATGLLALFFGGLGLHKFVLGYVIEGIIMLAVSIVGLPCFCILKPIGLISPIIMWIVGFVEGFIYLSKTDDEFHKTYEVGRKGWF